MNAITSMTISNSNQRKSHAQESTVLLVMVCVYIFLFIERPWESIRYLHGIPIERPFAVIMILVAFMCDRLKIVGSPTNKWVYGLLGLHFLLAPFAYNAGWAVDKGIEYGKLVLLYLLMLVVVDDEKSLRLLVKAFIFSMSIYMLHSFWEYLNGRHVYRMGISRMIGVDATHGDPNSFGASIVLSLPFVYVLLRTELVPLYRKFYYCYFCLSVTCVVLTGSRSAFVALLFLILLYVLVQKGSKRIVALLLALLAIGVLWTNMPDEKKERIRTLWDEDAGPANAHSSASGRLHGWNVSLEIFKQKPWTGVGAGKYNFIEYRVNNDIDGILDSLTSPTQSHVLYGQVLAEFGVFGAILFLGLISSIWRCSLRGRSSAVCSLQNSQFLNEMSRAIVWTLLLLLLLGFGGHNFYRPLWLWLAAWAGSLYNLDREKNQVLYKE